MVVLVTGAGAPGYVGTFKSLVHNYDKREIKIIATDCKSDVIGKYYCHKFYQIPRATDKDYMDFLRTICKIEKVDVILPQNTLELEILANSDLRVCVSNRVGIANDKFYLMATCKKTGVPYPEHKEVNNLADLILAVHSLGYPDKKVVIKPPKSSGSRGMRIIDDNLDYKRMFLFEKLNPFITLKNLIEILGDKFPDLLVMEYLEGDEYTIDCFRGNRFISIPRKREEIKSGISFKTSLVKDDELIEYSKKISEELDLKYAFGFQFKGGKILECNPRVQGTMIASTLAGANIIYSAVKYALGEDVPELEIDWNFSLMRYWGFK